MYALLILANPKFWAFIEAKELRASFTRFSFIESVIGRWPEAICAALVNEVLRDQGLPDMMDLYSPHECIQEIVDIGGQPVAQLWTTIPALQERFIQITKEMAGDKRCDAINKVLTVGGK